MENRTKNVLAICVVFLAAIPMAGQSSPMTTQEKRELLEVPNAPFHPQLSLQSALKIAEEFMASERLNTPDVWLYSARFILYGDPKLPVEQRTPGWHFWWVGDAGRQYVIFVSMDGRCRRLPTM